MIRRIITLTMVLAFLALDIAAQGPGRQDTAICRLRYALVNKDRHITGHNVSAECSLTPLFAHSSPYGNWGVESNLEEVKNSRQFDGWNLSGGFWQWNSCTSNTTAFPTGCNAPQGGWPDNPLPHSDQGPYYNHANCQEQFSNQGVPNWDTHAGVAPDLLTIDCVVSCDFGCLDVDNYQLTVANHFMTTFELDSNNNVQTGHLVFGNQTVAALCLSDTSCSGSLSDWLLAGDASTGVNGQAAVEIIRGTFVDMWGYCSQ